MSYPVDIYFDHHRIARGTVGDDGTISNVQPIDGKGLGYGRHLQFTATAGKHKGATVTGHIMGDEGGKVTLEHPMPFN